MERTFPSVKHLASENTCPITPNASAYSNTFNLFVRYRDEGRRKPIVISARQLVRKMRGGTQAHLIEADDGNCYVVKFVNNLQHRRVLINEWIAAQLMQIVGIPTPPAALIHVSPEFLSQNTHVYLQASNGRVPVKAGVHFGSRYPGHPDTTAVHDVLPERLFTRLVNRNDFIGALVFDRWVGNTDTPQAIFAPLEKVNDMAPPGKVWLKALMIDRGFAFGGVEWILRDSPIAGIHSSRAFYDGLRGISDCEPWLSRIEAIQGDSLRAVFDTIPQFWNDAADTGFERMVRDLLRQRCRVADSIIDSANSIDRPFRNWVNRTVARKLPGSTRDVLMGQRGEDTAQIAS